MKNVNLWGGQFKPAQEGLFKSAKGGLYDRIFHQEIITVTNNSFDNYGNVLNKTISVSDGTPSKTTSCVYDPTGRFIESSTDVTGYTSYATYRPIDGAVLSQTDPNGLTTTYNYSSGSNIFTVQKEYADGNIETDTLTWNTSGNSKMLYNVSQSITQGNTVTDCIDAQGQKLQETTKGYLNTTLTSTYTYNIDGRINTITDNSGNVTTYSYDNPDETKRLYKVSGLNTSLTYSYGMNPYSVSIADNIANQTKEAIYDALGNVTTVNATTKDITYSYFASGKVKSITNEADGGIMKFTYDPLMLNQLSMVDVDAGTTSYQYNDFGQLTTQTDAMSQNTALTYDSYGRLTNIQKSDVNGNTNNIAYVYSTSTKGYVQSITRDNVSETFAYDKLCRIQSINVEGPATPGGGQVTFPTQFSYNNFDQLSQISYPSGLTLDYSYDNVGNVKAIDNAAGGNIWTGISVNKLNQWTQFSLGNGLTTTWGYDQSTYMLNSINTQNASGSNVVQNLGFSFNPFGQLLHKYDYTFSETSPLIEDFTYDVLDRLTNANVESLNNQQFTSFADNGNISSTTLGNYNFDPAHPHAVLNVTSSDITGKSTVTNNTYTYNADKKILTIKNDTYNDEFTYGPTGDRFRVDMSEEGTATMSKVYIGNSEFGYNPTNGQNIYQRTIINSPTGVCAVYQDSGGVASINYVHTDYQGSWLAITDNNGNVQNRYSYDAWGRPRDPKTWQLLSFNTTKVLVDFSKWQPRFDRGYTGHEHLAGFGLINANGRLYDAYLQRFLSPDNDLQDPSNAQNFNRYSYCLNNPLRYTDPTGYESDDLTTYNGNGNLGYILTFDNGELLAPSSDCGGGGIAQETAINTVDQDDNTCPENNTPETIDNPTLLETVVVTAQGTSQPTGEQNETSDNTSSLETSDNTSSLVTSTGNNTSGSTSQSQSDINTIYTILNVNNNFLPTQKGSTPQLGPTTTSSTGVIGSYSSHGSNTSQGGTSQSYDYSKYLNDGPIQPDNSEYLLLGIAQAVTGLVSVPGINDTTIR